MKIVRNQKNAGSINEREMTQQGTNIYKYDKVRIGKMTCKQQGLYKNSSNTY